MQWLQAAGFGSVVELEKTAVVPGQLVRLVNGVVLTLVSTVSEALLLTLLQAPETVTE